MEERRRFPRLNTTAIMVNWRKDGTLDNLHRTKNISGGGMCLMMERAPLNAGDTLPLEFCLPTRNIIYSKARVAWINKHPGASSDNKLTHEAGIEFFDISDNDRKVIKQFVYSHLS